MIELVGLVLDDAEVSAALGCLAVRDQEGTRTLDLTEAALLEPDPAAERARLRSRGFVRARMVTWHAGDMALSISLYELGDAQQAALAVQDTVEALRAAAARMGTISGLPGAVLVDDDALTIAVTFDAGPVHAIVLLAGGDVDQAGVVATSQQRRLLRDQQSDR